MPFPVGALKRLQPAIPQVPTAKPPPAPPLPRKPGDEVDDKNLRTPGDKMLDVIEDLTEALERMKDLAEEMGVTLPEGEPTSIGAGAPPKVAPAAPATPRPNPFGGK